MIVSFCGHSDFSPTEENERVMLEILERRVGNTDAEMYLGGYGGFDEFAYKCCRKYKESHRNVSLIFVTPYLSEKYLENKLGYPMVKYDGVVYPDIEDKPVRFAIEYRNKWMAEKSDLVICFIARSYGGAYKTYSYAKRKGKEILNIHAVNVN